MNEQEFWGGAFGDDYTARNRVDWRARIPFWREVIEITGARSVFEVGCNSGWNLSAIQRVDPHVMRYGCELNERAAAQAQTCGHRVIDLSACNALPDGNEYDLVFTAGVLIHVGPDELPALMQAIVDASAQYVLAVEYADEREVEVGYRGHAGKLWRRPFGRLYQDMGLTRVRKWPAGDGFDACTAWLLEKAR